MGNEKRKISDLSFYYWAVGGSFSYRRFPLEDKIMDTHNGKVCFLLEFVEGQLLEILTEKCSLIVD